MADPTMAEQIGAYTMAGIQFKDVLYRCGVRRDAVLRAMAPYETTPNDTPVPLTQYPGTYTLDTAAKVAEVSAAAGPRAGGFWNEMIGYQL